jgi:hypothetical protein
VLLAAEGRMGGMPAEVQSVPAEATSDARNAFPPDHSIARFLDR